MNKKLILAGFISLFAFSAFAQTDKEEEGIIQELFGMEKKAAVAEFLNSGGGVDESFWEVYDAYEAERKSLGKKRIEILETYAEEYFKLDDAKTEAIMKETLALSKAYDKLVVKYYKKVKKTSGVKTATQFYQIEMYLKGYIRTVMLGSIPFVGEFE